MNHFSLKSNRISELISFCILWAFFVFNLIGCGSSDEASYKCSILTGTSWAPKVSGVSADFHDPSTELKKTMITAKGSVFGLSQPVPVSGEISVSIDMNEDLGQFGSLTLIGEVTDFPNSISGSAFANLVSLHDGSHEWINLSRNGGSGDCTTKGYYICDGSNCFVNSGCTISWPSAYSDRTRWEQHQGYSNTALNYPSVNIFPTCNWSGGTDGSQAQPACAFYSYFFPPDLSPSRLKFGTQYTARYALISDTYTDLKDVKAGLKVTVIRKKRSRNSGGGAVDINLILVGTANVQASRTEKGQQNLNTLVSNLAEYYGQSGMGIKLGAIRAFEFPCENGGERYSHITLSELGDLLAYSRTVIPPHLDTKSLNIFLVSSIKDDSEENSNLTILGVDGAIGGPPLNGTAESGMVISTFDKLDTYNPSCDINNATCPLAQQESAFFTLAETTAHEMGHFLGLNHLSEATGKVHDSINDTPICTATQSMAGNQYITINSCVTSDGNIFSGNGLTCKEDCLSSVSAYDSSKGDFCPSARACEFNNIMWWTTKNFQKGTGKSDGNLFSTQQGGVAGYHPLVQ